MLHAPSHEQTVVVDMVRSKCNLSVTAVAGAGKSTTCFHAARAIAPARTLVLCFNASLAATSLDRVRALGLDTLVDCMTVHGLASRMYGCAVHDPYVLQMMLSQHAAGQFVPQVRFDYALVVLDEAQDLNEMLLNVVRMMCVYNSTPTPQWLVVGDAAQEIYGYSRSTSLDLLRNAALHLPCADDESMAATWAQARLQDSYRLTEPMCVMLRRLFGCDIAAAESSRPQQPPKPQFVIGNIHSGHLMQTILSLLREYPPDDMIVLAPSVRTAVCGRLCLQLSADHHVPVYSSAQTASGDTRGRLVFSSFHQSKGLERRCVVVFGIGASYQSRWAAQPNPLHVALTRARERLVIFHQHTELRLAPFRDDDALRDVCAVHVMQPEPPRSWIAQQSSSNARTTAGTSSSTSTADVVRHQTDHHALVRFVPDTCVACLVQCVQISKPKVLGRAAAAASTATATGEWVAHLYEPAVMAAFEHHHSGGGSGTSKSCSSSLLAGLARLPVRTTACLPRYCQDQLRQFAAEGTARNAAGWLCAALIMHATATHSMHVPHQVQSMDWVGDAENAYFVQCMQHLDVLVRHLVPPLPVPDTMDVAAAAPDAAAHGRVLCNVVRTRTVTLPDLATVAVEVCIPLISSDTADSSTTDSSSSNSSGGGSQPAPWLLTLASEVGEEHLWHAAFIMWVLQVSAVRVFLVAKNEVLQIRAAAPPTTLDALVRSLVTHKFGHDDTVA